MSHQMIAILAGAIVNFVTGAIWYSPVLFVKPWIAEVGKPQDQFGKFGPAMAITAVGVVLSSALMYQLLARIGVYGCMTGVKTGAAIGLLGAIAAASGAAFEGRSVKLYLINAGHILLAFTLQGAAIASVVSYRG